MEDGVLAKRFDFIDDENDSIEFISYTLPEHGELSIFGLDFLYQPAANYFGTDSFEVTLRDDQEPESNRTTRLIVEVNSTNDPLLLFMTMFTIMISVSHYRYTLMY